MVMSFPKRSPKAGRSTVGSYPVFKVELTVSAPQAVPSSERRKSVANIILESHYYLDIISEVRTQEMKEITDDFPNKCR